MLLDSVHTQVKRKRRAVHEINYEREEFGEPHHLHVQFLADFSPQPIHNIPISVVLVPFIPHWLSSIYFCYQELNSNLA